MEAASDSNKINEQIRIALQMGQEMGLNDSMFGIIWYKGAPEVWSPLEHFSRAQDLFAALSTSGYKGNPSAPVDFQALYSHVMQELERHCIKNYSRKYLFLTTYGGHIKNKDSMKAFSTALVDSLNTTPVVAVLGKNASSFQEAALLVADTNRLFRNTSDALRSKIPTIVQSLLAGELAALYEC